MRIASALAAFSLSFAAVAPAGAIYLAPDLVQIPADRLVANLTRQLATLPTDSPDRARLEVALGRLHTAAWAQRSTVLAAQNPLVVTIEQPEITSGELEPRDLRGALAYLGGRGGSVFSRIIQRDAGDREAGCDPTKVALRYDYQGKVVLEITLKPNKDATDGRIPPAKVRVLSQDLGEDEVGACLAQRVRTLDHMPAVDGVVTANATFTFRSDTASIAPFYGFGDSHIPPTVADTPVDDVARAHLTAAKAAYERAIAASPDDGLPRLGLAWVLEMGGDTKAAIAAYRAAFEKAWATEKDLRSLGLGQQPIAVEAAHALLRLLPDDQAHADDRERLSKATMKLSILPRPVTPIVVPLGSSDSLVACVDPDAGVSFDLDGSGVSRPWGWIRPGAAWLVYDAGATGVVRSGLQLFGSVSFWSFWRDGYQALAALDDDGDGLIRGDERRGLALWEDRDGDGVSDPGEVADLDAHGIIALSTRATNDANGVLSSHATFSDGRTRPTWDWISPGGAIDAQ